MSRKTLILVLAGIAALKLLLAVSFPLAADESLHWMQSRHLAWGFMDHPPGTALFDWVGRHIFMGSVLSVRFFSILSSTMCSVIAFALLRETGRDEHESALAALAVQLIPIVGFGVITSPVFAFMALIFAAQYFVVRAIRSGKTCHFLLLGLFLGAATMTYYLSVTAMLAMGLFCLFDVKGRRALRKPGLWLGALLGAAIVMPNVWWNIMAGSESAVTFQLYHRSEYKFALEYALIFIVASALITGPFFLIAWAGTARSLFNRSCYGDSNWTGFFALFVAVPFLFILPFTLFREAGAHWVIVSILNTPLLLVHWAPEPDKVRRWIRASAVYTCIIGLIIVSSSAIGLERLVRILDPAGKRIADSRIHHWTRVRTAAIEVSKLKKSFEQEGRKVTLAADKWSTAGRFSFYTPGNPYYFVCPAPVRHGQDYKLWNLEHPPASEVIYVSLREEPLESVRAMCASMERLPDAGDQKGYYLFLCHDFKPPVFTIIP